MVSYRFDLYPRTDPLGTLIRSFTSLQKAAYRAEANGTSTGQLAVRSTTDDGQAIDPLGLQYVRVAELPGGIVRGGFFLEKGKFAALTEDEDHLLTFSGAGTLSYLSRASMAPYTYLSNDIDAGLGSFDDAMDPFDDTWRLYAQGFGNTIGAMLWRVVKEATLAPSGPYTHRHVESGTTPLTVEHDADRPESAIPAVTLTFDYETDSSGNPWTLTSGEFTAQVGENLLSVVKRLMEAGLYVELDPDTFELRAWEQDVHRAVLDATGGAWATDVVRFQSPTDPDDLSTGNIKDDALRNIEAYIKRSALWAGGGDVYGLATSPSDIPWEGHYRATLGDTEALEGIAAVQLQAIAEAGDTLKLRLWMEDDPANGRYLPWDHVLLDQQVTVHTGTDQWEFNERTFPVAALTVELKSGGNWDCIVELGASYSASASRQFQVQGVGAHTHSPNPRLCERRNLFLGLRDVSLKASAELVGYTRESACDGILATFWSDPDDNGLPGNYWAADLGSSKAAVAWRLITDAAASEVATAASIYGSNDPDAWTWLPNLSGPLSGDPAANDWTLIGGYSGGSAPFDSGDRLFENGTQTYRYWLFLATDGPGPIGGVPGADWNINEVQLWSALTGHSNQAARCDHPHNIEELLSASFDTDLVLRPDGSGGVEWGADAGGSDLPWVNVLDYGADPTGVADSWQAFDDALETRTERSAALIVPPGVYRMSAPLVLGNSTVIFGVGSNMENQVSGASTLTYRPHSVLYFDNNTHGIISPDDAAVTYRCHHPVIENITVRGGGLAQGKTGIWLRDNASSAVVIKRVGLGEIRNCYVEYWGTGIDFDGTADSCNVLGGHVHDCDRGFVGGSSETTIDRVVFWDLATGPAIELTEDRAMVTACEIQPLVGGGILVSGDYNRILGNDISDVTGTGISVSGSNNTISTNTAGRNNATPYADSGTDNVWGLNNPPSDWDVGSYTLTADAVKAVGRWEPVTDGVDTFVWDGDEIVVHFVETP